ncbi:hypothetical protein [Amycolatopsis sp. lyj-108]|uniref:hypothetical protein n=1 Tax=Amycolatopsis sp. lyj-108 TaxID=2789286 RepID=UPI00397967AB
MRRSLHMAEDPHELIAFTDFWACGLEESQFTVSEGPSVEAYVTRWSVLVNDLTAEQRWPGWGAAA